VFPPAARFPQAQRGQTDLASQWPLGVRFGGLPPLLLSGRGESRSVTPYGEAHVSLFAEVDIDDADGFERRQGFSSGQIELRGGRMKHQALSSFIRPCLSSSGRG
jgi:hypothetical protein